MDRTIKQRLDVLDVGFDGSIFKEEIKNGWKVRTSNSGLKIATVGIDYANITWSASASVNGLFLCSKRVNNLLPTDLFTYEPIVDVSVTSTSPEFCFTTFSINPPSETYVGDSIIMLNDILNSGAVKPDSVYVTLTAIGF